MNNNFEHLFAATGDLLNRVRLYDRNLIKSDEIVELHRDYRKIETKMKHIENEACLERAIEKLQQMKFRLLTMMEDLLFTA
jgi:hypothetical protein